MSPVYNQEIVPIPGFSGYGASRDGRIWSKKKIGGQGSLNVEWRERKQCRTRGYCTTHTMADDGHLETKVHRLVVITFIGEIPPKLEINHKDGDKTNNKVENLEITNHRDNLRHALAIGTRIPSHGENHYWHKLSNQQVQTIKYMYVLGYNQREIAKIFKITQTHVSRLIMGKQRVDVPLRDRYSREGD